MESDQPPSTPSTNPRYSLHDNPTSQGSRRPDERLLDPSAPSQGTSTYPDIFQWNSLPEIGTSSTSIDMHSYSSNMPNIPHPDMQHHPPRLDAPSQRIQSHPLDIWPHYPYPPPATSCSLNNWQQSTSLPQRSLGPHPQSQEWPDLALSNYLLLLRASTSSGPPPEAATASLHRESVDESEPLVTSLPPIATRGIELVSPRPADGETTVQVRRDIRIILKFDVKILSRGSTTYDGLKIPKTPSVNKEEGESGKKLLHLHIRVLGATTKALYKTLCHKCKDRDGDKDAFPDFRAKSNIVVPQKNGRLLVAFTLACCSKHREPEDSEYCLEVVLSGDSEQNTSYSQYQLPYSFSVVSKQIRNQVEGLDAGNTIVPPRKKPRAGSGCYSRVGNPVSQGAGPSGTDVRSSGDSRGLTNNISSGTSDPPAAVNNHHPTSSVEPPLPSCRPHRAVNASSDEEPAGGLGLVIEKVFPNRGPTTGGPEICILGSNFPTDQGPLYASFGDNFVRAVFHMPNTLLCSLPQASVPGIVPVNLRRSPDLSAPVMGKSLCKFEYFTDLNEILSIMIRIQEDCTPEVAAAFEILRKETRNPNLKRDGKQPLRGGEASHDEIETAIIQALAPLQDTLNFGEVISKTNDYKQTLAHFAAFFGYTNLLRRLMGWNIDLTIADVNGFTALHCAYKEGDRASVDLLLAKGAPENVLDALGRAPSHLMPAGFASLSDHGADTASDVQPELEQKRDAPYLFQSTDSGNGELDSGEEESVKNAGSADLMHQSQSSSAASSSQSAPRSSSLPVALAHAPISPTSLARCNATSAPPPNLSPPPSPPSFRPHASSISSLRRGQVPLMTSVPGPPSMYIPPGVILAVPADHPSAPPLLMIPYNPRSHHFVYNHQSEHATMNRYASPPPPLHSPFPPDFQRVLSPPPRYRSPLRTPLYPHIPFAPSILPSGRGLMANLSANSPSDYSATAVSSPDTQQPSVDRFEENVKEAQETQQYFESFACDGLNGGAEEICEPEAQHLEDAAAPQPLDVKTSHGPLNRDEAAAVPVQQAPLPLTAAVVETNPDNGITTLPSWLSLVQPQPEDQVITIRRECQVALDIKFEELLALPRYLPVTQKSLVIPLTANVRTQEYYGEGDVLHLSVRVYGADTHSEYKSICNACSEREGEGKKKGETSLVDFYAASNVIKASDAGLARVKFNFSCSPNHQSQNESAYLLEVALLENQRQGQPASSQRVVATCRLPWHFKQKGGQVAPDASTSGAVPSQNDSGSPSVQHPVAYDAPTPRPCARNALGVPTLEPSLGSLSLSDGEHQVGSCVPTSNTQAPVARDPGTNRVAAPTRRKRRRVDIDLGDEDERYSSWGRRVRPRLEWWNDGPSTITGGPGAPPANHSCSRPFTTIIAPGVNKGTTPDPDGIPSSNGTSNTPAAPVTPWMPQPGPSLRPAQGHQSSAPPVELVTTVLRSVNPRCGPVSGGIEIWLVVNDLPVTFTLYAKFGDKVAATFVRNMHTLTCILPSASCPGRVRVTLSRAAYRGAPEYGTSLAEFEYLSDHASVIPILLRMENGRPEYAPTIRAVVAMLRGDVPQDSDNSQTGQIESSVLGALLSLRKEPNLDDIITTSNDSSQTLVHLSVLFGYMSLLEHLVGWRINLTVADISGLTALHYACQKGDWVSIRTLLRGGAPSSIEDKLGRVSRDQGSFLAYWTAEGSPLIEHPMGREIALGKYLTSLEPEKEYENDSVHGGSDPGSDASNNSDEDEERMYIVSPTLDPGPSVSTLHVLWSWVSCLLLSSLVFSYFIFPLCLFHSLVPQAVM